MKFMLFFLLFKLYKLLIVFVDLRYKKVFKVKNVVIIMDLEKEKVEKERVWFLLVICRIFLIFGCWFGLCNWIW